MQLRKEHDVVSLFGFWTVCTPPFPALGLCFDLSPLVGVQELTEDTKWACSCFDEQRHARSTSRHLCYGPHSPAYHLYTF